SDITSNTATCGGSITNNGGAAITARGVCWSTTQNPTAYDSHTTDGTGTGSFASSITGIIHGTTYYVRAYATNSAGTAYGDEKILTTLTNLPILTTTEITSIANNTATSGGDISFEGAAAVTARGVCWSTTENPTITDSHTEDGSGTGIYTSSLTGLTNSTSYYVRAYAINSAGTAYGENRNFTTQNILPTVTTRDISAITFNTATSGGDVTSEGGAIVTVRGICWSTTQNPIVTDSYTTNGEGIGGFISYISDLTHNTTYYVRAYATNSAGTAYGNEKSFVTIENITGQTGTLTDIDGTSYNWVGIGAQAWMAENLKVAHYSNGDVIPLVTDNSAWALLEYYNDAYCYYDNNSSSQYGALYTWAAAMKKASSSSANPSGVQGVCPTGWHLPSNNEWIELRDYIGEDGHSDTEGAALKASSGWNNGGNGTDDYGFSALPGGYRDRGYYGGLFHDIGDTGYWWSSTERNTSETYFYYLSHLSSTLMRSDVDKSRGSSVRCVKD
ncbi:MAG: hypothetical protein JEZ09_08530, partial [Salinivirgaceae bacterium]|nr:hypothetical protein [Salinivirgaceae bacterium]